MMFNNKNNEPRGKIEFVYDLYYKFIDGVCYSLMCDKNKVNNSIIIYHDDILFQCIHLNCDDKLRQLLLTLSLMIHCP